jgi:CRISPR type I-E-associated protein CasB/Cse2
MAPDHWSTHLGALMPVLVKANLPVQGMEAPDMARWASIVHLVATLAGTAGTMAHAGGRPAGRVLFDIRFSEARLEKLLSARGAAMADRMARLARFLASNGGVPLDLRPLADLISHADRDSERTENARLRIAGDYYGAAAQTSFSPEATS